MADVTALAELVLVILSIILAWLEIRARRKRNDQGGE